jgi:hypothetical protein
LLEDNNVVSKVEFDQLKQTMEMIQVNSYLSGH